MDSKIQVSLPPMELQRAGSDRPASAPVRSSSLSPSIPLIAVVKDVLIRHFGNLKVAAAELKIDHGQLSRDLLTGDFKFKKIEGHTDATTLKQLIAKAMHGQYGGDDPKARKRRVIRAMREHLDELAEIEDVA